MDSYVITDPKLQVIYGVVDASSETSALLKVLNDPQRMLFDGDQGVRKVEARFIGELVDDCWREVAPLGAQPHGDCGGDIQASDSWGRRFAMVRPDQTWAVVSISWYAINRSEFSPGKDIPGEAIERQAQFEIGDDLRDLDQLLWWTSDYTEVTGFPADEAGAMAAAAAFGIDDITWDGDR